MSTVDKPLKYLFVAKYQDGRSFAQPTDDTSRLKIVCNDCGFDGELFDEVWLIEETCPACSSRSLHRKSAFADVDMGSLESFWLNPNGFSGQHYGVDLITGMFHVGGVKVQMHPVNHVFQDRLKLIFYRVVEKTMSVTGSLDENMNQSISHEDLGSEVKYYVIGWESGNLKREMVIT